MSSLPKCPLTCGLEHATLEAEIKMLPQKESGYSF